jgi:sterol desaturase/sphingolipid hydroxylase (fatty acid hydroxylase superfamily)
MHFHDLAPVALAWMAEAGSNLTRYAVFAVGVWLTIWVLASAWLAGRKIRPDRPPARQLVTEFLVSLRTVAIFSTNGTLLFVMERAGLLPLPGIAAHWGLSRAIAAFVMMVIGHDAWFYWTHRAMHDRRLFRTFHRRHHRSGNPSPFSAYSFDLAEAAVQAAFVTVWVSIVPTPWPVVGVFMLHQIVRNTLGHAGYELYPARRDGRPLLDFMTTTTHHDLHHAQAGWNYGLYFTWWDRMMGTEHPEYHARFAASVRKAHPQGEPQGLTPARAPIALAIALSLGAASARPADAQEVRLQVTGKDPAQVRDQIRRSAEQVCRAADRQGRFLGVYTVQDCLADAERSGLEQYRAYLRQAAADAPRRTAEAGPAAPESRRNQTAKARGL